MPKRFREDVEAASIMQHHLRAMDELMAVDTTGYRSDPYGLLEHGSLLILEPDADQGEEEHEDQEEPGAEPVEYDMPLKVTDFLKSELPLRYHAVINSLRSHFASRLMTAKMEELNRNHQKPVSHIRMNRPGITYFNSDRPLMRRVLQEMDGTVKACLSRAVQRAQVILKELGPEVGIAV